MSELKIQVWAKDTGNLLSHTKGLTEDQIKALQNLKVGDRLIVYKNNKMSETSPDFTIKVYKKEG
jgi:hypothetical protein